MSARIMIKTKTVAAISAIFVFGAPISATAGSLTYDVSWTDGSGDLLTGTITTDGTIGAIGASDIAAWAFTSVGSQPFTMSSALPDAAVNFNGSTSLTATASALLFDFQDTSAFDRVLFYTSTSNGQGNSNIGLFSDAWVPDGAYGETWQYQGHLPIEVNPSSDVFATAPVPVPAAAWLMMSGLGAVGFLARGRIRSRLSIHDKV